MSADSYYNRGKEKLNLRQYAEAIKDFDEAIKLNPNHALAYRYRGFSKANLDQYSEAIKDYDKAIQLDPNDALTYRNRGISKSKLAQHAEATKDYDKATELDPNYTLAYRNRGFSKSELGQHVEAIKDYDKAIQLDPNDAQTYRNRGFSKANLGQYSEAIKDYDKAIQLNPNHALAYRNRGFSKANLGQHSEAIKDYDKAIQLTPNDALTYRSRGFSKSELAQHAEAIKDYNKAIQLDPNDALTYRNRGISKANSGHHPEAIKDYNKAIQLDPNNVLTYRSRGFSKSRLAQHTEAIKDYDKAIQLGPNEADNYKYRGKSKYHLRQYEEAIKDFDKAINLNAKSSDLLHFHGLSYSELGNYELAVKSYSVALGLTPQESVILHDRGYAYYNLKKYKEAEEDCRKAIEHNPKDSRAFYYLGLIFHNVWRYSESVKYYTKALEISPRYSYALSNRAYARYFLGDYQNALQDLNEAINLNENDANAFYHRSLIHEKLSDAQAAHRDREKAAELFQKPGLTQQGKNELSLMPQYAHDLNKKGGFNKLIEYYNQLIIKYPSEVELYIRKAKVLYDLKKHDEAALTCDDGIKRLDSSTAEDVKSGLYYLKGCIENDNNNFSKSIDYLKKALIIQPKNEIFIHKLDIVFERAQLPESKKRFHRRHIFLKRHQLIGDAPTHYECALLSQEAYHGSQNTPPIVPPRNWHILTTAEKEDLAKDGYFAVAFKNDGIKTVVIAHRGSEFDTSKDWLADAKLFLQRQDNEQIKHSLEFTKKVEALNKIKYHIYHTGHSLGAALAEICAFEFMTPAVTFESLGVKEIIELRKCEKVNQRKNIITYLAPPNVVNTMGSHIGRGIHIFPHINEFKEGEHTFLTSLTDFVKQKLLNYAISSDIRYKHIIEGLIFLEKDSAEITPIAQKVAHYTFEFHNMTNIVNLFDSDTGEINENEFKKHIVSWPKGIDNFMRFYDSFVAPHNNIKNFNPREMLISVQKDPQGKFNLETNLGYKLQGYITNELMLNHVTNIYLKEYLVTKKNPLKLSEEILSQLELDEKNEKIKLKAEALINVEEFQRYLCRFQEKFVIDNNDFCDQNSQQCKAGEAECGFIRASETSGVSIYDDRLRGLSSARETLSYRFFSSLVGVKNQISVSVQHIVNEVSKGFNATSLLPFDSSERTNESQLPFDTVCYDQNPNRDYFTGQPIFTHRAFQNETDYTKEYPITLATHFENGEPQIFFDRGLWDNEAQRHLDTGELLFTYRVFKKDLEIGSIIFYKHPILCRSEDGMRHNIIALNGIFTYYDIEGKLRTVEDICEAFPPTLIEQLTQSAVRGALHGVIRGTANVIRHTLEAKGLSKQVSQYINNTVYYGGMFTLQHAHHYQSLASSNIPEAQKITTAAYQAAFDTGTLVFTQTVINKGCQFAGWLGQKAQQYGWEKIGQALQHASSYGGYGSYAYQTYTQGMLQACVSVSSGIIAEKAVEKIGEYSIKKILGINGFFSERRHEKTYDDCAHLIHDESKQESIMGALT